MRHSLKQWGLIKGLVRLVLVCVGQRLMDFIKSKYRENEVIHNQGITTVACKIFFLLSQSHFDHQVQHPFSLYNTISITISIKSMSPDINWKVRLLNWLLYLKALRIPTKIIVVIRIPTKIIVVIGISKVTVE